MWDIQNLLRSSDTTSQVILTKEFWTRSVDPLFVANCIGK